ncbi:hypothetical protein FQA39_LY16656 [Lamprigera yunnana]|nr:hypothetical protein FQA39_LY16656 [Lamprigera yunnana]
MSTRKYKNAVSQIGATSTPITIRSQSSTYQEKSISPIIKENVGQHPPSSTIEENDYSEDFSETETTNSTGTSKTPVDLISESRKSNQSSLEKIQLWLGIISFVVAAFMIMKLTTSDTKVNSCSFVEIQQNFSTQTPYTWEALESGIKDIKQFNKPSVFIFLYDEDASKAVDLLIQSLSRYASCVLNEDENIKPIMLTSTNLNTIQARSDYGLIIEKYKPELEKRSIMIVKNLDNVSGEVAQAFHTICDEFTPLVNKALIIFTIQTGNLTSSKTEYQIVEDILKKSWKDLDDDIFYPLITRITSMILKIEP